MDFFLNTSGCVTSAGIGKKSLWEALWSGEDLRTMSPEGVAVCQFPAELRKGPVKQFLSQNLLLSILELNIDWKPLGSELGVILASTKGCSEDFIWDLPDGASATQVFPDPMSSILKPVLEESRISPRNSAYVNHACASSLVALTMAREWIRSGHVRFVLILACDSVGPFIRKGFKSLNAMSPTRCKPFDRHRDGLLLGEATAALLVSAESLGPHSLAITGVHSQTWGMSATRPAPSGEPLQKLIAQIISKERMVDTIVAHGTGTLLNDSAEDLAYQSLTNSSNELKPTITATKWCIGHTLGASGAVDLIVASEIIHRQKIFGLHTTQNIDPEFHSNYQRQSSSHKSHHVLVSSLGFGGVLAAATLGTPV